MRQQQRAIESEYEDKIRTVQEQLQSEKEGRVALQEELQRLREEKMNASLRSVLQHILYLIVHYTYDTLYAIFLLFIYYNSQSDCHSLPQHQ